MDDRDVEDLLKRYRPAGPPDSLREHCLVPSREERLWPWATAAAALLATTLGIQVAAGAALAGAQIAPAPDPRASAAADLAEALGGDPRAEALAEEIIDQQMRRDRELAAQLPRPAGEAQ